MSRMHKLYLLRNHPLRLDEALGNSVEHFLEVAALVCRDSLIFTLCKGDGVGRDGALFLPDGDIEEGAMDTEALNARIEADLHTCVMTVSSSCTTAPRPHAKEKTAEPALSLPYLPAASNTTSTPLPPVISLTLSTTSSPTGSTTSSAPNSLAYSFLLSATSLTTIRPAPFALAA